MGLCFTYLGFFPLGRVIIYLPSCSGNLIWNVKKSWTCWKFYKRLPGKTRRGVFAGVFAGIFAGGAEKSKEKFISYLYYVFHSPGDFHTHTRRCRWRSDFFNAIVKLQVIFDMIFWVSQNRYNIPNCSNVHQTQIFLWQFS